MRTLPDASVDTVITSPPYFRLRNYQHDGQIGLERHVDQWVAELRTVIREAQRVLKPTGSLWLNLGDSFSSNRADGAPPKSLLLAPERVARAMLEDGWIIRNKVIWSKPNPMPTSVRDRLSCTYEVVYFATRSSQYYFDLDAVRRPHRSGRHGSSPAKSPRHAWAVPPSWRAPLAGSNGGLDALKVSGLPGHPLGKNAGDVWTIPTAGYRGAHHAVYPEALLDIPIRATVPEQVCTNCGDPWRRQRYRTIGHTAVLGAMQQHCACLGATTRPGIVLDPFIGAGTTAIAAENRGRDWLGIEVNPDFAAQAEARIAVARSHRQQTHGETGAGDRAEADKPVTVGRSLAKPPVGLPRDPPDHDVDLDEHADEHEPSEYGGQTTDAQHPPTDVTATVAQVDGDNGTEHGAEHDADERADAVPELDGERGEPGGRLPRIEDAKTKQGTPLDGAAGLGQPDDRQQSAAAQHNHRKRHSFHARQPALGVSHRRPSTLITEDTDQAAA